MLGSIYIHGLYRIEYGHKSKSRSLVVELVFRDSLKNEERGHQHHTHTAAAAEVETTFRTSKMITASNVENRMYLMYRTRGSQSLLGDVAFGSGLDAFPSRLFMAYERRETLPAARDKRFQSRGVGGV